MNQIVQNLNSGQTKLEKVPFPTLKPGSILIKSTRSLISLGTEKMLVEFGQSSLISKARQQPDKVKLVLDKVKTDGLRPTIESVRNKLDQPLPLGYCNVGKVIDVGPGVTDINVVSNGPHAEIVCVPRNLICRIPDSVDDEDAAFTVVSAIGLQGIRLINPTLGETVVVIGLGLIGLLTCQLLKANGCKVIGFDFDADKVKLANTLGVTSYNSSAGLDPVSVVMKQTFNTGADAVVITASTTSNELISQAANMSRKRGRIVLVGVIGLNIRRADFYEKELSFQVSCSYGPGRYDDNYELDGHDYPLPFVRWTENRNFQAVLDSMASGTLRVKELITLRIPLEKVTNVYENLQLHKKQLGIVIEYGDTPDFAKVVKISETKKTKGQGIIAVIGSGNFSQGMILPCLRRHGAKIKTIVSSKGVNGNHAARKFGIEQSSCHYEEVLNDDTIDTVIITTPHNLHATMCTQALEANKNVFVEKPLALTTDELETVIKSQCDHNDRHLIVGFNRRFSPMILKVKELLPETVGPINIVFTVNAGFISKDHWTQDIKVGGGRILGEACHFIDLVSYVASSRISSVSANALGNSFDKMSDNVMISLKFENGSQALVSYLSNGSKSYSKERMEVFSDGRVLVLDNFRRLDGYGFKGFKKMKVASQDKGHDEQFKRFLDSMKVSSPPIIPFHEIVNSTKSTLAVLDSLEKGGIPVEV
jgi:predicted dehydrogenase/threonine dehydrogenase-like Zn-dependent dehydrogenase